MANKTIDDLSAAVSLSATDRIELSSGKYCTLQQLADWLIAAGVVANVTSGDAFVNITPLPDETVTFLTWGLETSPGYAKALEFPSLIEHTGAGNAIEFNNTVDISSLSFPVLTTHGGVNSAMSINSNTALASLSLPVLASVAGDLDLGGNIFTSLSLPALVTIGGNFSMTGSGDLVTVSLPVWVPTDGTVIDLSGNALSAASVNHILARCVAAGVETCTINLSGGANAAPTGQGITDAAALDTAGNSVTTN